MIVKKLRKPCAKCGKKFIPGSRTTRLCDDCWERSRNGPLNKRYPSMKYYKQKGGKQ